MGARLTVTAPDIQQLAKVVAGQLRQRRADRNATT
jgi:hypothetical protein